MMTGMTRQSNDDEPWWHLGWAAVAFTATLLLLIGFMKGAAR